MTVQEVQRAAPVTAHAPAAEMEQMHLREPQGVGASEQKVPHHVRESGILAPQTDVNRAQATGFDRTQSNDVMPTSAPQTSPRSHAANILTGPERKLADAHSDYEEGLLRAAHERKRAHEAEAFLAAEQKKAEAMVARRAADADAEAKLAAAKAAEKKAKVEYKMELKVDKAHEKFEKKAALAVERAEFKKAAVQEAAEEKIVAAMEKAEHVRAGEEVLKPSLTQKLGLKKKDF